MRIIKLVDALPKTTSGKAIAGQLVRSGTSVGANYRAALRARSKPEFVSKVGVVIEESDEALFWLDLIIEAEILPECKVAHLRKEADELLSIFCATKASAQKNLKSANLKS
ncbi:MAG: four helix bundle protein [Proteobacteria bacterium]|nr:four helix bundle protein [Pseudomonadota bacterium]